MNDAVTKPISRLKLRELATKYRKIFGYGPNDRIDPIRDLERIGEFINPRLAYSIVDNDELPRNIHGSFTLTPEGGSILIKESVYDGARKRKVGGYRMDICHEICHAILAEEGYVPIAQRDIAGKKTVAFCSCEWQAKALAGEIMIPYEATKGMTSKEIMAKYGVSKEAAEYRLSLDINDKGEHMEND